MSRALLKSLFFLYLVGSLYAVDKKISKSEFGRAWPLKVDSGTLSCSGNAVMFAVNGVIYAVNGTATMRKLGKDIDPIWDAPPAEWFTDPATKKKINLAPPKKSIGPLIDAGLALCK